jgi:DNA-binding response OmpR family regulator
MINDKLCLLIADDELKITKALCDFFKANGFHVLSAADGGAALDLYYENNTRVDLVLLDVMMPVQDGFSVLKEIRSNSLVPVIMLTARGEEYDQIKGFKYGADDYIPKPFSLSLLLARVEAVLKRVGKDKSNELVAGELRISVLKRAASVGSARLELTPKEFDLLHYLVLNKNVALTREQILNAVWGYDFEGELRTVDTHVKQLRAKLNEYSIPIRTIHKVGYQFEAE